MHAISKSVLWLSHGSKSRSSVKLQAIIIDTNININDSIIASVTMKQLKWGDESALGNRSGRLFPLIWL